MKNFIVGFSLFAIIALNACGGKQPDKAVTTADSLAAAEDKLYIKDKLQYEQSFIDELRDKKIPEKVWLVDSTMIVGKDTAIFPSTLKAGKMYYFKGKLGKNSYELAIIRMNYTTVDYDFSLTEKGITTYLNKGQANISPMFYLGSESDPDEDEGDNYAAVEYSNIEKGCTFNIRIGLDKDGHGRLRAKIKQSCEEDSKDAKALNDCPVMKTE